MKTIVATEVTVDHVPMIQPVCLEAPEYKVAPGFEDDLGSELELKRLVLGESESKASKRPFLCELKVKSFVVEGMYHAYNKKHNLRTSGTTREEALLNLANLLKLLPEYFPEAEGFEEHNLLLF